VPWVQVHKAPDYVTSTMRRTWIAASAASSATARSTRCRGLPCPVAEHEILPQLPPRPRQVPPAPADVYNLNSPTLAPKARADAARFIHDWKIKPPESCRVPPMNASLPIPPPPPASCTAALLAQPGRTSRHTGVPEYLERSFPRASQLDGVDRRQFSSSWRPRLRSVASADRLPAS